MVLRKMAFLVLAGLMLSFVWAGLPALAEVRTEVLEGIYVLPVAELVTTRTEPDIIEIENDRISIRIIPNRGRILSSYLLKDLGESFLYQNYRPGPMVLPGGLHVVEFGGYFLSVPWNMRDRQPYDLEYEITRAEEDMAEVYLFGRDMFLRTLTEAWVRVRAGSPVVEIEVLITNTSGRREAVFDLKDYVVLDTEVDQRGERLLIPADEVKILESYEAWLGEEGEIFPWPDILDQWTSLERFVRLTADTDPALPATGIYHPEGEAAMIKFWNPGDFFQGAQWWSWGMDYAEQRGADSYVVLSSTTPEVTLAPEESIGFTVYFTGFTGVKEEQSSLENLYQRSLELL